MKAVGCVAGAKGTAKIQTLALQNPNGQVRGDSNGSLLPMQTCSLLPLPPHLSMLPGS